MAKPGIVHSGGLILFGNDSGAVSIYSIFKNLFCHVFRKHSNKCSAFQVVAYHSATLKVNLDTKHLEHHE